MRGVYLRACYRRGFNDGLDAASKALAGAVAKSNLRKRLDDDEEDMVYV